jgi:hypothetical protein
VGVKWYLANKLTANAISSLEQFARYISAPIALRYGTSKSRIYSSSSSGRKKFLFISNDRTIIRVLKGWALSIKSVSVPFFIYMSIDG